MSDKLRDLSMLLREGQKRSGQTSLGRRAPAEAAVPYLQLAMRNLRRIVDQQPANAQAWRLLSQAAEALLDYRYARSCLEKTLALEGGSNNRRDLKKLALLREYEAWWAGLGLTPSELEALGSYLGAMLDTSPCDRTLHHTWRWLALHHTWRWLESPPKADQIIQALEARSGYCDCQVLNNVVRA